MTIYITKLGEERVYDNKAHMRKCYAKNKDRYNAKVTCNICNKTYSKTNTTHHNNTKVHQALLNYINKDTLILEAPKIDIL
jgi:hypothetical protein